MPESISLTDETALPDGWSSGNSGPLEALKHVEAHFIQRSEWKALSAFYKDTLKAANVERERAQWAEKLAEVLETELGDIEGAAEAWGQVAAATGETSAVAEQMRLLRQGNNLKEIAQALDAGVKQARSPLEQASALVLRADYALHQGRVAMARVDFEAALRISPQQPHAAAGLAELSASQGDTKPIQILADVLSALPRDIPQRGELFRRLARLLDSSSLDVRLALFSWSEVLVECPGDEEASARLLALTRLEGNDEQLEKLLMQALAREPRGPHARLMRMELVALFERTRRGGAALHALKQAVKAEPGHQEAWLAYADRLIAMGQRDAEAAWALEHAATASDAPEQKYALWLRLSRFVREQLGDAVRAEGFEKKAELVRPLASVSSGAEVTRLERPVVDGPEQESSDEFHNLTVAVEIPEEHLEAPAVTGPPLLESAVTERQELLNRKDSAPLDPEVYRALSEHFERAGDEPRSALMLEVAQALAGDTHVATRAPRLILGESELAELKHPLLRGDTGELLSLVGMALCRLNPARGKGTTDPFTLEGGRGARGLVEAMLAAVRILGMRSPELFLSEELGPPFSVVFTTETRMLVGTLAYQREVAAAELRFFAGRALFTQRPELLVLRNLKRDQVLRGLELVRLVAENRASPPEMKLIHEVVPLRLRERFKHLVRTGTAVSNLASLAEGARHSVNRAGLVVCGGVAPALAALREKKALPSEMIELVQFASSETYLQLRSSSVSA